MTEILSVVSRLSPGVWKLKGFSNFYVLPELKMVIDTGARSDRQLIEPFLTKIINPKEVKIVILTHMHTDHVGNVDWFPNATFLASKAAIASFQQDPERAVLDDEAAERLKEIELQPIEEVEVPFEVIYTPGHTKGDICLWLEEEKILFSGDTLFPTGIGRTDLPFSVPHEMQESLNKLVQYNFKILAAGHD